MNGIPKVLFIILENKSSSPPVTSRGWRSDTALKRHHSNNKMR